MDVLIKENRQITLSAVALNVAIMCGSAFDIVMSLTTTGSVPNGYHNS